MADSLDDFFARKDKKRGKDKVKAAALSTEALVRELEEGSKQVDYPVRKDNKTSNVVELLGLDANDADWRDFEDVEKRDYTGLKVKEMSLQDQTDEEQRRLSEQVESIPESTPWKLKDDQQPSATNINASTNCDAKQKSDTINPISSDTKIPGPVTPNTAVVSASSSSITLSSTSSSAAEKTSVTIATTTTQPADESKSSGNKEPESDQQAPKEEPKGDKPSAKAYVPPQARMMNSEIKILVPSKLGKSKNVTGRHGPIPDIQDKQAFPSLG